MDLFNDFILEAQNILKIHSVEMPAEQNAPFGMGVRECLNRVLNTANKLGFSVKDGDGYYGYAEVGRGDKMFAMLGHLDTVPLGSDWTVPPLEARIVDGVLYGRGVLDDKVPILACLYATAELISEGFTPNKRIRIIFGCDEETGWLCMNKYVSNEELPSAAFTPDSDFPVINCEKGVAHYNITMHMPRGVASIKGGERVNMVMDRCVVEFEKATDADKAREYAANKALAIEFKDNTMTAMGVSAHGSTPHKGQNALWTALDVLSAIIGGEWNSLKYLFSSHDGAPLGIACSDTESGNLTINIGTISSSNEMITMEADVRYPISKDKNVILSAIRNSINNSTVTIGGEHDPLYIAPESKLVATLLDAYTEVTGKNAEPISIGGATYARAMPNTVAFGPIFPGEESTIHQRNERESIDNLRKMYNIYKAAIRKLGFDNK